MAAALNCVPPPRLPVLSAPTSASILPPPVVTLSSVLLAPSRFRTAILDVPGSVQCTAGQTTTVQPGKSPTAPKPASLQQLQQLIEDTEPAIISSISPAAALPGTNFDSNIAGSKMGKVTTVTVAGGSGVYGHH